MNRFLFAFFIFFVPTLALAQSAVLTDFTNTVNLQLNPNIPEANEQVIVRAVGYTLDMNSSTFSWYKDGQLITEGVGIDSISVNSGEVGQTTAIKLILVSPDGFVVEKTATINPGSLDILWQAQTYTPDWYKGKALFSAQSTLTLSAEPQLYNSSGQKIDKEKMVYKWKEGTQVLQDQSGYGKHTIEIGSGIIPKTMSITLEVTGGPLNPNASARQTIQISPATPQVYLYKTSPLYGIQTHKTLDTLVPEEQEIQVTAEPFFFSSNSNLFFSWILNGQTLPDQNQTLTLRSENTFEGQAVLEAKVSHPQYILQEAHKNITIQGQ